MTGFFNFTLRKYLLDIPILIINYKFNMQFLLIA